MESEVCPTALHVAIYILTAKSTLSVPVMRREPDMAAVSSNFILLPTSAVTTLVHIFHVSPLYYTSTASLALFLTVQSSLQVSNFETFKSL